MEIRTEPGTDIPAERPEVYEPPMLDEIGGFAALTRADADGLVFEGYGYYPE